MSCRETSSGSAFTSWARLITGRALEEPAVLSTFHYLRNLYLARPEDERHHYTADDYRALIARQRSRVQRDTTLSESNRNSILERLDQAANDEVPDQATLYALHNVTPTVRQRAAAQRMFIRSISSSIGQSEEEVQARFRTLSRGRTRRNTTAFSAEVEAQAEELGIARDRGSIYAMATLMSEARDVEIARLARSPRRISNFTSLSTPVEHDGVYVSGYGYDPRNERLEIIIETVNDDGTTTRSEHAYRGITEETFNEFRADPHNTWLREIRGNESYQYSDSLAAARDGVAPRCAGCGQYANTSHSCPSVAAPVPPPVEPATVETPAVPEPAAPARRGRRRAVPVLTPVDERPTIVLRRGWGSGRWSTQSVPVTGVDENNQQYSYMTQLRLPAVRNLQQAVNDRRVTIEISESLFVPDARPMSLADARRYNSNNVAYVRGSLETYRNENNELVVNTRNLRCACPEYQENSTCRHVRTIEQALRNRIDRPTVARSSTPTPPSARGTLLLTRYGSGRWTRQDVPVVGIDDNGQPYTYTTNLRLPAIRTLQQGVAENTVTLEINEAVFVPSQEPQSLYDARSWRSDNNGQVRGNVEVSRDENNELVVNARSLRCSCQEYRDFSNCRHVRTTEQAIRDRINRPNAEALAARTQENMDNAVTAAADYVARQAEQARATDWMRNPETAAEAARTWRRESEVVYSEDNNAYLADLELALTARAAKNGEPDIPYMRENALDGLLTRESGRGFGVEIEYEYPSSMTWEERQAADRRIGQELYAAGLTYDPSKQGYGASKRRGVRDTHSTNGVGNWSWENDGSVAGELVTPIMYDEPETWDKLAQAVEILRRNGAIAGTSAGSHVHIGTNGQQDGSVAMYTELGRIVTQHEDALVRLASNPVRGTHRNNGYSGPLNPVGPTGFRSVSDIRRWQQDSGGRYAIVNFAGVQGGENDHPEFRLFDSTLDAGAIQTQVKLAAAITSAAERNAAAGGTTRGKEPWGVHVKRNPNAKKGKTRTVQEIAEDTNTVKSLVDMLFRRREDKQQILAVLANTDWSDAPQRH